MCVSWALWALKVIPFIVADYYFGFGAIVGSILLFFSLWCRVCLNHI